MHLSVGERIEVTSKSAPGFGERGIAEEIDAHYAVLRLVGVRFEGQPHLRWYSELELGRAGADASTEQIEAVTG